MNAADTTPDAVDIMASEWAAVLPDHDVSSIGIVSRMLRLVRIFEQDRERALRAVELESWSFDMLAVLRRRPGAQATPAVLISAALVTSGTMTARLKSLEARGWIHRSPDDTDRRQVNVSLTVPGRQVFDKVFADVVECQRQLIACLDPTERAQLTAIFRKMLVQVDSAR